MKTNSKKKILVSTLALAMGAGLAGSISGSVAWYQYSTRTTAQLQGVSAGTTRNLQIRVGSTGTWKQDLAVSDIKTYLDTLVTGDSKPTATKLTPVTNQTSDLSADAALTGFKGHPVYQYNSLPAIDAAVVQAGANSTFNYIQIPLQFRVQDNGHDIAKDVYLVDAIFGDTNNTDSVDVTPAIRVHITDGTNNALLADTATSTNVSGALDLNNNHAEDRFGFTGADNSGFFVNYGKGTDDHAQEIDDLDNITPDAQLSYKVEEGVDKLLANDADAYDFVGGKVLGTTHAEAQSQTYLELTLTIWLEGWAELGAESAESNLWSSDYSGLTFDLGLRFACEADA